MICAGMIFKLARCSFVECWSIRANYRGFLDITLSSRICVGIAWLEDGSYYYKIVYDLTLSVKRDGDAEPLDEAKGMHGI